MRASYFDPAAYPDPIVVLKDDGSVAWVNAAFCQVFGRQPGEWKNERFPLGARRGDPDHTEPRFTSHHVTLSGPIALDWRRVGGPRKTTIFIGRDVAHLHQKIEDLHNERHETEGAMDSRMRFLATASHEMRTPLNGIIGVAGLLLKSDLSENQRAHADAIRTSGVALLALVNDVLDISRLDSGRVDVQAEAFEPVALVQSVVELLSPRAQEKGLEIASVVDPSVPSLVKGDEARIRQILFNLVGNAVKFTETGGVMLEATLRPADGARSALQICVRDTGPGVAPEDQDRIFEEFTQTESTGEGAGLGLAISRRLARSMGGAITLSSAAGAGAAFSLRVMVEAAGAPRSDAAKIDAPPVVVLATPSMIQSWALRRQLEFLGVPNAQVASDRASAVSAADQAPAGSVVLWDSRLGEAPTAAIKSKCRILIDEDERQDADALGLSDYAGFLLRPVRIGTLRSALTGGHVQSSTDKTESVDEPPVAQSGAEPAKILLAEDNEINIVLATAILRQAGHAVDVVKNGAEAVKATESATYDVVLMDMRMPVMDGLSATRAIRERGDATPIIAMTANALESDRLECIQSGMNDFVPKPFEPADLHAAIERHRVSSPASHVSAPTAVNA